MITHIRRPSSVAAAIIALYLLLAFGYSLVNPIFEAPDEHHHFFTAVAIANTYQLPIAQENLARQEAAQPPLYYLLGALLIAPLDTAVPANALWLNPYAQLGIATSPTNQNAFVHSETWPWPDYVLAVHLLRGFSILLGAVTLWAIYSSGRLLWPLHPYPALLAIALVAFLPQFLFLHASVTNDALIICLCALALWQVVWLATSSERASARRLFILGLTLGTAVLSKTAGLLLLAWVMVALGWLAWRYGRLRWRDMLLFTLTPALLMAGWLLWRNWTLYGDPTATRAFIALAGGDRSFTVWQALRQFDRVWQSLFAFFGWMTVQPPRWLYWVWYGMVVVGVVGIFLRMRDWRLEIELSRHSLISNLQSHPIPLWLGGWVLLVFIGWLQFMMRTPADQGRLLFPALLPLALGLGYGLSRFRYGWLAAVLALGTAVYALSITIPQAYARPPLVTMADIPATAVRFDAPLGPLELIAAEVAETATHPSDWQPGDWQPGGWVEMTLYWRMGERPSTAPVEVIEILGREWASAGKVHMYHGNGRYPATLWPTDRIIAEQVAVQLDNDTAVPTQARIIVKLLDVPGEVEIGRIKVTPREWPKADTAVLAQFGDGIQLTHADLIPTTTGVDLQLRWQVTAAPQKELTVFVHGGDPTQPPLVQADGPPLNGNYPTSLWEAGEVIEYTVTLPLPEGEAGEIPIHIGLYDPATGVRLPVTVNGERQPFDAYGVGRATSR